MLSNFFLHKNIKQLQHTIKLFGTASMLDTGMLYISWLTERQTDIFGLRAFSDWLQGSALGESIVSVSLTVGSHL